MGTKKNSPPLVSVILIVKNGEAYLQQALESVLAQSYPSIEVVLVDGNSTDRTLEIARSFPQTRIFQQKGTGTADAYNTGIVEAKGEFLAFIGHDDYWEPDKTSAQMEFLTAQPNENVVGCMARYFADSEDQIPNGFRRNMLEQPKPCYAIEALLVRTSVFEVIGDFDDQYGVAADMDIYAKMLDAGFSLSLVPELLLHKRVHLNSTAHLDINDNNRNFLKVVRSSIARKRRRAEPAD